MAEGLLASMFSKAFPDTKAKSKPTALPVAAVEEEPSTASVVAVEEESEAAAAEVVVAMVRLPDHCTGCPRAQP